MTNHEHEPEQRWTVLRRTIDVDGNYILLIEDEANGGVFWIDEDDAIM